MTEQVPPRGPGDAKTEPSPASGTADGVAATTGIPAVDSVLADVDLLDHLPVEEHLAAFERAHDSLRAALDAPPVEQPGEPA